MREGFDLHRRLRETTRPAHDQLDGLFAGGLRDQAGYVGYLSGMHTFLGAARDALPALHAALARIEDDLATAGIAAPACPSPVAIGDGALLGWRYVIDGSALGARILLRQAQALGHDAGRGARFLAAHAAGDGWSATRRELAAFPPDDVAARAVCAAAAHAFAVAHAALRDALAPHREVAA